MKQNKSMIVNWVRCINNKERLRNKKPKNKKNIIRNAKNNNNQVNQTCKNSNMTLLKNANKLSLLIHILENLETTYVSGTTNQHMSQE
mgnify:CR=1 FL=1